ncbi:hypothetical protein CRENBAI_012003 [Crenichthys baileyi]|uniref:Uncharacterized protein n=1 Tax=Crenichthys baileyi TaxID=28760 RepID=A0AAV9QY46_9TELE
MKMIHPRQILNSHKHSCTMIYKIKYSSFSSDFRVEKKLGVMLRQGRLVFMQSLCGRASWSGERSCGAFHEYGAAHLDAFRAFQTSDARYVHPNHPTLELGNLNFWSQSEKLSFLT